MSEKHVAELMRARARIASGESAYICDALRLDTEDRRRYVRPWSDDAFDIVEQIRADLGYRLSLAAWLRDVHGVVLVGTDEDKYEALRATRLAWIDDMIKYWKDKP